MKCRRLTFVPAGAWSRCRTSYAVPLRRKLLTDNKNACRDIVLTALWADNYRQCPNSYAVFPFPQSSLASANVECTCIKVIPFTMFPQHGQKSLRSLVRRLLFLYGLERRKNVSKLLWYIKSGRTTALAMPKRKKSKFLIIDTRSA